MKIKPQKFILSTPNFEYNVAFNKQTSFRHDDHHFEFTRAEFKEWYDSFGYLRLVFRLFNLYYRLNDNVHPPYSYNIVYVGQLDGNEQINDTSLILQCSGYQELEGATQFAEITRDDGVSGTVITENEGKYEKVYGRRVKRETEYCTGGRLHLSCQLLSSIRSHRCGIIQGIS